MVPLQYKVARGNTLENHANHTITSHNKRLAQFSSA